MEQKFQELDAAKTEAELIAAEEINDLKVEGQKVAKVKLFSKIICHFFYWHGKNSKIMLFMTNVCRLILY